MNAITSTTPPAVVNSAFGGVGQTQQFPIDHAGNNSDVEPFKEFRNAKAALVASAIVFLLGFTGLATIISTSKGIDPEDIFFIISAAATGLGFTGISVCLIYQCYLSSNSNPPQNSTP